MIYELLQANSAEDLQIKINEKLAEGWELYGNLVTAIKSDTSEMRGGISFTEEGQLVLFQAVTKQESTK